MNPIEIWVDITGHPSNHFSESRLNGWLSILKLLMYFRFTLLMLEDEQREKGVIAASAGNHAQALAYHGGLLGKF